MRLISHDLRGVFPPERYPHVTGIGHYSGRAAVIAGPGTILALPQHLPQLYQEYLWSIGIKPEHYLVPEDSDPAAPLQRRLFDDPATRRFIQDHPNLVLSPFIRGELEDELCTLTGIGIEAAPRELVEWANNKARFKELLWKLGMPTPRGKICPGRLEEVIDAVLAIHGPQTEVGVKIPDMASAEGMWRLKKDLDILEFFDEHFTEDPPEWIVEEWLKGVVDSPSAQVTIDQDGTVRILEITSQILEADGKTHKGNRVPANLPLKVKRRAYRSARKIAAEMARIGWVGYFGIDFILLRSGMLVATEINGRITAAAYPLLLAELIGESSKVVVSENFALPRSMTYEEFYDQFWAMYYNPSTGEGIVPNNVFCLPSGKVTIIVIAHSHEAADWQIREIEEQLASFPQTSRVAA